MGIGVAALAATALVAPTALAGENGGIAWVQIDGDADLFIFDPRTGTGGTVQRLGRDFNPDWSPVAHRIAYESDATGAGFDFKEIYVLDGNGVVNQLTNDRRADEDPEFSPDGELLAFTDHDLTRKPQISVMTEEGTGLRTLTSQGTNRYPNWSPDGSRIVFVSTRLGGSAIYTMRSDGTDQRVLYSSNEPVTEPSYSPDGRWILFSEEDAAGQRDLFRIDATAPAARTRLTDTAGLHEREATYSPDGSQLLFSASDGLGNSHIFTSATDGTARRMISAPGSYAVQPDWQDVAAFNAGPVITMKGRPKAGSKYPARKVKRLRGSVTDVSGVAIVKLGMRSVGRECRHLKRNGGLSKPRTSCRMRMYTAAEQPDASSFDVRIRKRLPSGRYRVRVTATDLGGNAATENLRFRIR